MHLLLRRASFALAVSALGMGMLPSALRAQPAGQATDVSVDCDKFADGQHEVPIVVVTKPSAGTTLPAGLLAIQGAALDCHADVGTGISRVAIYLGRRDAGGLHLGDAVLRGPNPIPVLPADQYARVGWSLDAPAPLKAGQVNELYVYARSDVTNVETVVTVPIVGAGAAEAIATPQPTPAPPSAPQVPANNIPVDLPELAPEPDEAPPVDEMALSAGQT
jgi:hypothetical protein